MSDDKPKIGGSAESKSDRAAFERMTGRLVASGMEPRAAVEKARDIARRSEHTVKRKPR